MGASQSTRDIPDHVYVVLNVMDEYVKVHFFVSHTNTRYQLQTFLREKKLEYNQDRLLPPVDPREVKEVYVHLHADEDTSQFSLRTTKTLEQLIEERNQAFS